MSTNLRVESHLRDDDAVCTVEGLLVPQLDRCYDANAVGNYMVVGLRTRVLLLSFVPATAGIFPSLGSVGGFAK